MISSLGILRTTF